MADFIDLNSTYRDREKFPNPADYVVLPGQMKNWWSQPRSVRAFSSEVANRPVLFVNTLKLIHIILPYSTDLQDVPLVYVNVNSQKYKDKNHIYTIQNNSAPVVKFVCEWDKVQNNSGGNPAWIHYKTNMSQVIRFAKDQALTFQVYKPDGSILQITDAVLPNAPDPTKQVYATVEVVPYQRDDEFSHHLVEYLS